MWQYIYYLRVFRMDLRLRDGMIYFYSVKIAFCVLLITYFPYTTCLVHTLSSRNQPMLKGAYKSYVEVRNLYIANNNFYFCMKKFSSRYIYSYKIQIFFDVLISDFEKSFICNFYMGRFRLVRVCTKHVVYTIELAFPLTL
jgi:hypothetical protein